MKIYQIAIKVHFGKTISYIHSLLINPLFPFVVSNPLKMYVATRLYEHRERNTSK